LLMGEQLPSGILLFFALAFFVAAVFVFFSGSEGISPLSAVLAISLILFGGSFVWLMSDGGGGQEVSRLETGARIEPENTVETTSEETTSATRLSGQSRSDDAFSYENYCIEKQFAEVTQGMEPQQAVDYETEVISEAVTRGVDPRTVLTGRGFPC
jgi:hypothetical protein